MKPAAIVLAVLLALWLAYTLIPRQAKPPLEIIDTGMGLHIENNTDQDFHNMVVTLDTGNPVGCEILPAHDSINIPLELFGTTETIKAIKVEAETDGGTMYYP